MGSVEAQEPFLFSERNLVGHEDGWTLGDPSVQGLNAGMLLCPTQHLEACKHRMEKLEDMVSRPKRLYQMDGAPCCPI